jgi:signal transduction histidine kinase
METVVTLYIWLSIISSVSSAILGWVFVLKPYRQRTWLFGFTLLAQTGLVSCIVLGTLISDPALNFQMMQIRLSLAAVYSYLGVLATFTFTMQARLLTRWVLLLLLFPLLLVLGLIVTSTPTSGLFITWGLQPFGPLYLEAVEYSPWYAVNGGYQIFSGIIVLLLYANFYRSADATARRQSELLLLGALIVFLVSIVRLLGVKPDAIPNLLPLAYLIFNIVSAYALIRFSLFNIAPITYDALMRDMPDPLLVVDMDNHIWQANHAAECLFGRPNSQLQRLTLDDLVPAPDNGQWFSLMQGETLRFFDVRRSPLLQNGAQLGTLLVLRDMTERKQAERERERLIAELDDYAHQVAHDLKGPISGMTGYLDLILTSDEAYPLKPATLREYHLNMMNISESMVKLVEDMLLLARVRNQQTLPVGPLDVAQTAHTALSRLMSQIRSYNATIRQVTDLPMASGYGPWVEQVWTNYLSNALKYGGKSPTIEIGAEAQGNLIRYWVRDYGVGLNDAQQAQLFSRFSRLAPKDREGHGVGLSIVKTIIEKQGGTVGAHSKLGQGSTFYFTLPALPTNSPNQQTKHEES